MLVLLDNKKVTALWPQLKLGIGSSLPKDVECTEGLLRNILSALLVHNMRAWLIVDEEGLCAILTTTITKAICEEKMKLLIYSLYVHRIPTKREIADAFNTLSRTAKSWGCQQLVMTTDDERILKVVRRLSGGVVQTYAEVTLQ